MLNLWKRFATNRQFPKVVIGTVAGITGATTYAIYNNNLFKHKAETKTENEAPKNNRPG